MSAHCSLARWLRVLWQEPVGKSGIFEVYNLLWWWWLLWLSFSLFLFSLLLFSFSLFSLLFLFLVCSSCSSILHHPLIVADRGALREKLVKYRRYLELRAAERSVGDEGASSGKRGWCFKVGTVDGKNPAPLGMPPKILIVRQNQHLGHPWAS